MPRIISNSAISLDGKLTTFAHERVGLGTQEDWRRLHQLRASADAVLVGGRTFRTWGLPFLEQAPYFTGIAVGRRPIINAVLTRRGVVAEALQHPAWPDPRVQLWVLGPTDLDALEHVQKLGAIVKTTAKPTLTWAIQELVALGCETILLEGGGDRLFQALEANLLHELYVTLTPMLVGGAHSPTLVDGAGFLFGQRRKLRLLNLDHLGDEVFFHYEVRQ